MHWMILLVSSVLVVICSISAAADPIDIGSRLELLVDHHLIDRLSNAELVLHRPTEREVVLVLDAPWEGNNCFFFTVFQDGDLYRMYYRGRQLEWKNGKVEFPHEQVFCYAESKDGVRWVKPELGLVEFEGSKQNNIILSGLAGDNFSPFKDTNPDCQPEAKYKGLGHGKGGMYAFKSSDGIHWSLMSDKPVITKGAFDSQNLAFWDGERQEYRAYFRGFRSGKRDILTATSQDFIHWTDPVWLKYPGAAREQLYTNQIAPYYRAPHLLIGFPTRYIDRGWSPSMHALSEPEHRKLRAKASRRYGTALSEGLLMSSRDRVTFHRWAEAFLRPGPRTKGNWKYGDNYIGWHVIETASALADAPNELSLYATEGYWTGAQSELRRYTLRMDGFVSAEAPMSGGELVTKPIVFAGGQLVLNVATSAAGSVRVEIQDAQGKSLPGHSLKECAEVFGDSIEHVVTWKAGDDVSALAGQPVRLRFALKDADVYAFRFRERP